SERKAKVSPHIVDPGTIARGAHPLFRLLDSPKVKSSQSMRVGSVCSMAHHVRGCHLHEQLHFVVQVPFGSVPAHDPPENRCEPVQEAHAPSNTLVTANEMRFQRSRCCSSWRRPEAVRR